MTVPAAASWTSAAVTNSSGAPLPRLGTAVALRSRSSPKAAGAKA